MPSDWGFAIAAIVLVAPLLALLVVLLHHWFICLHQTRGPDGRTHAARLQQANHASKAADVKPPLSAAQRRALAARGDCIREDERRRIAREIHDELGQNLMTLRIDAAMLFTRTQARHSRIHVRAGATMQTIDASIRCIREIINDLRPSALDLGLFPAAEWLVARFRQQHGVECELLVDGGDLKLDDEIATACFRVLQESLCNVARHANASYVLVELRVAPQRFSMLVRDNGIGMRPGASNKRGSFGLAGMEERIDILGGSLTIESEHAAGTTVRVDVPFSFLSMNDQAPNDRPCNRDHCRR